MAFGSPRFDYEAVTSTNDVARDWARQNVAEGALFVASYQTAGRGRRGASWTAQPGESALMTFVAYPSLPISQVWRLPIASGVAVVDALSGLGIQTRLKWPNDILLNGCKLGGILVETVTLEPQSAALIGIGINVHQQRFGARENFALAPISLHMARDEQCPNVKTVVEAVAEALPPRIDQCAQDWTGVYAAWQDTLIYGLEQSGIDAVTGALVRGAVRAVREDGAAWLEIKGGLRIAAFPAGTSEGAARV